MKPTIALVRGKFLNRYDMQSYEPLADKYSFTAFGSLTAIHDRFQFPTVQLASPLDLPDFPYKTQLLNRLFCDSQYLFGLEYTLHGFDIAHSAETYFHYTKQCLSAKKQGHVRKVVVTVWENIPFNNEGIWGRKAMKRQAFAEADHFIAVSEKAKQALVLESCDEKKISVVHPGIDTTRFSPGKKSFAPTQPVALLFVGRLVKNKGVYELLDAMHTLARDEEIQQQSITLTIIGEGPEKSRMIAYANKLGVAGMIQFQEVSYADMPNVYRSADIFIAPSKEDRDWQEQWGMALMEAQACGLPIVTTRSGSIPENVGDAAVLVAPGNSVELAVAIKQFILNPKLREEYAKKARQRAVQIHDVRIVAKKIEKIYEKALKNSSP